MKRLQGNVFVISRYDCATTVTVLSSYVHDHAASPREQTCVTLPPRQIFEVVYNCTLNPLYVLLYQ